MTEPEVARRFGGRGIGALVGLAALLVAGGARALGLMSGESDQPLQVDADEGIEWQQDQQIFIARGNAVAVRGDVTVRSDVLRAYYRKKPDGTSEVWRMDAEGNVVITAPTEKAYAEKAIYDVDNGILVLTGRAVRFVTPQDEISANRQLEFWEKKGMAVARGNAVASREGRKLRADTLTAHLRSDAAGKSRVWRVEAFDNVVVLTDTETVTSSRAVYNVDNGLATLTGAVKITRGDNQLNGCTAEVNVRSGTSLLKACASPGPGGDPTPGRVRGLIMPGSVKKN